MSLTAEVVAQLRDASMRARLNRSNRALVSEDILASAADELEALSAQLLNAGGIWGGDAVDTGVPAVQTLVRRTPLSDIEGRLAKLEAAQAAAEALPDDDDQDELLDAMDDIAREEGLDWDRHRGLLVEKAQDRLARVAAEGDPVVKQITDKLYGACPDPAPLNPRAEALARDLGDDGCTRCGGDVGGYCTDPACPS